MTLKLNNTGIRLRPSSVVAYYNCPHKWALTFLEGHTSRYNGRAAIGTAIHAAAEVLWTEAIATGKKDLNVAKSVDAAVEAFKELDKLEDIMYGKGEDLNTAVATVAGGAAVFVEDIAVYTDIPLFVEKLFEIAISGHPIVTSVGGTLDYLSTNTIADVKTSQRAIQPQSHVIQQSIYKHVAEANGYPVEYSLIQGVVLTKQPKGIVDTLEPNVSQAKKMVNGILNTTRLAYEGNVSLDVLFHGNTGYYLCTPKYCDFHSGCKWAQGDLATPMPAKPAL